jgi:hypothetical protein
MSKQNRSTVTNAAIAAILGAACGASAGLWSVHHAPPKVTPVAQTTATPVVTRTASPPTAASPANVPAKIVRSDPARVVPPAASHPVATKGVAASARANAAATSGAIAAPPLRAPREETVDPLQRARALAQRPDVKALVALRDSFVRRAEERGDAESDASKQQLEELNRYLAEARALRLKLDAEEFRKASADPNKPR